AGRLWARRSRRSRGHRRNVGGRTGKAGQGNGSARAATGERSDAAGCRKPQDGRGRGGSVDLHRWRIDRGSFIVPDEAAPTTAQSAGLAPSLCLGLSSGGGFRLAATRAAGLLSPFGGCTLRGRLPGFPGRRLLLCDFLLTRL